MPNPNQAPQPLNSDFITHVPNAAELAQAAPAEADPLRNRAIPREEVRAMMKELVDTPPEVAQEITPVVPKNTPSQEAARQASIAAADRENRQNAGLPPRPIDI